MTVRLLHGDCRELLRMLPDQSVQCVVTSPPYWGLRDYGVDGQIGLETSPDAYVEELVDVFREVRRVLRNDGVLFLNLGDSYAGYWGNQGRKEERGTQRAVNGGMLTPVHDGRFPNKQTNTGKIPDGSGLKPKDLVGIPWLVAFALQTDGWVLRSEIIWAKSNPMPESVTDRPTKSHEQVFLFAKARLSRRAIKFFDLPEQHFHFGQNIRSHCSYVRSAKFCILLAAAIFDRAQAQQNFSLPPFYAQEWQKRTSGSGCQTTGNLPTEQRMIAYSARFLSGDISAKEFVSQFGRLWGDLAKADQLLVGWRLSESPAAPHSVSYTETSVTIHDASEIGKFDFAHNELIVERAVDCNAYFWDQEAVREPVTDEEYRTTGKIRPAPDAHFTSDPKLGRTKAGLSQQIGGRETRNIRTVWTIATSPFAEAHFATFPPELAERCIKAGSRTNDTVLDPFSGAGTTALVADRLGRHAIGIELNQEYHAMAEQRLRKDAGMFAEVTAA